jgi:hypothetical protein
MKQTKQTTPMTFSELVDETVEHYTTNPRSRQGDIGPCQYAGPNGERCAAARLCDESLSNFRLMDDTHDSSWGQVEYLAVLKPEYAHFTVEQIRDLQEFHDTADNWLKPEGDRGTEGLSMEGVKRVRLLKGKYPNPETPES